MMPGWCCSSERMGELIKSQKMIVVLLMIGMRTTWRKHIDVLTVVKSCLPRLTLLEMVGIWVIKCLLECGRTVESCERSEELWVEEMDLQPFASSGLLFSQLFFLFKPLWFMLSSWNRIKCWSITLEDFHASKWAALYHSWIYSITTKCFLEMTILHGSGVFQFNEKSRFLTCYS